ncbi:hypothetical protein HMPREF1980_02293, partial [Actinomyces sp. oral taxon 172 str. F0311]
DWGTPAPGPDSPAEGGVDAPEEQPAIASAHAPARRTAGFFKDMSTPHPATADAAAC